MVLPLEGIKVVEFGVWAAGPTCARVLGELGADVIKLENPAGGDPARGVVSAKAMSEAGRDLGPGSPWLELWNGSKRSIAVDVSY